ncbi:alpha/beta hydrolase [Photobacterium sagamiensis]|uniref:alpha/beta hydrolase n=1 Tax=Photobacterium sagamiensis TaxID=2910241 RepID=UPI003D128688
MCNCDRFLLRQWLFFFMASLLTACVSDGLYQFNLMPAPDVYDDGTVDPFVDNNPIDNLPYGGVLYATDREPADEEHKEDYYQNKRGHVLRLGAARIELGTEGLTWEEARKLSLAKNRTEKYPLRVSGVTEFGILETTIPWLFVAPGELPPEMLDGDEEFVQAINEKLSISKRKHVYIYVHGYKVIFENPALVATELWHFLGYDGVFIAYAWPSTPKRLAYVSDVETTGYSAHNLRKLIEYIAASTQAEQIHIVGYSAGTRVVVTAIAQLALQRSHMDREAILNQLRLGHVILVGSDFDRGIFGALINDGFLNVPQQLSIYLSEHDKALGLSSWMFAQQRLGQVWKGRRLKPGVSKFMREHDEINLIDVTDAEKAASGNGHAYFRKSP